MQWIPLYGKEQLDTIDTASQQAPILIFKHSTRCSISSAALNRLEKAWSPQDDTQHTVYYLDLIRHRALSNAIADRYGVEHESPQVLVIRDGRCVHATAHFGITYSDSFSSLTVA